MPTHIVKREHGFKVIVMGPTSTFPLGGGGLAAGLPKFSDRGPGDRPSGVFGCFFLIFFFVGGWLLYN